MLNWKRGLKQYLLGAFVSGLLLVFGFGTQVFAATAKTPVVFVHGLGGSATNFYFIKSYLKSKGWTDDELVAVELPSKTGDQILNAATISQAVNQTIARTGHSKVDIVAHSMGGANSLYYILNNGGQSKVEKLVTLGGANRLTTSSAPAGIATTSIYSTADFIVNPYLSRLDGANNIQINFVDHIGLLANANVNSLIETALSK